MCDLVRPLFYSVYLMVNFVCISISEEEPGPLRSDTEGKSVTKVSRTFSYLKSKMYKKTRVSFYLFFRYVQF